MQEVSIFDGTPAGAVAPPPPPGAAPAAPAQVAEASPFDGEPPEPKPGPVSQAPSWPRGAWRYVEPDEPGYTAGGYKQTDLSREHLPRFLRGEDPPAAVPAPVRKSETPATVPPTATKSGLLANLGAGGNAMVAGTLGLPVDIVTGGINLAFRGINAGARAVGAEQDVLPPIVNPAGGSQSIKKAMGLISANPDDVQADGVLEEAARGVGGGVVGALLPAAAVGGLGRLGVMGAKTGQKVLSVAGDFTRSNTAISGGAGAGSEVAAEQVPDQWKPLAGMAGGLAAVGPAAAVVAGGRAAGRAVQEYRLPTSGPLNSLTDLSGAVITGRDGVPINLLSGDPLKARRGQVKLAARQLRRMASNPARVSEILQEQGPPAFPGNPTTAQLTGDTGLLTAERGISRSGDAQKAFLQQSATANDIRVGSVRSIGAEGDVAALPAAVQEHVGAKTAAADAEVERVRAEATGNVAAVQAEGETRVAGVQSAQEIERAKVEAESAARLSGLQTSTEQARQAQKATGQQRVGDLEAQAAATRDAVGGDLPAGSDAQVGASVRQPLVAFDAAARARESAAWRAIDPDGKLAVDMKPIRQGAKDILEERSSLASPLQGTEAAIFETATGLKDVHTFKDLTAFRARLTDAIRAERMSGTDPQAVRRLSMLLDKVHETMEASVVHSSDDQAAARFTDLANKWHDEQANAASTQPANGRTDSGSNGSGGPPGVPQVGGAADPARPGAPAGRGQVAPGAADELGDPLKSGVFGRRPPNIVEWIIHNGGMKDDRGDFVSMGAKDVHQRAGGRLINGRGMSADYIREGAVTEGFLGPNADLNDLKAAIEETIAGNPRYRQHEQHEGETWGQSKQQKAAADDARYAARDAVAMSIDESGVRLSPAEIEHATDLVMYGEHPEDAIRQASDASADRALDDNAKKNAFGSPGLPLAEQADNGLQGGARLEPNFDQSAADRYAAARQLTAERKGGFEGAPGVKSALQGGPTAGSFKLPDAAVPASVVRVGPSGADHVRVYLEKGGDVEALVDAAAFSLRREATRADGSLDPARVASWAQKRASFLSAVPDAATRFGDAATAQTALETARAAEKAGLKRAEAADVRALREAGSAEAQSLKAHASEQVKQLKAATKEAADALKAATATAEATIKEALANRATQVKEMQKSVLGRFMGEADPVMGVDSILRRPTAVAEMRQLSKTIAGDPAAQAGLRRTVGELILRYLKGDTVRAGGEEKLLKSADLQKFIRLHEAALSEIMTGEEMNTLRGVAASLERSDLSVGGSKLPGGSDSVQIAMAGKDAMPTTFMGVLGKKLGAAVPTAAGAVGGMVGGLPGAAVGFAGVVGLQAAQAAREAGIKTVEDLVATAMLHPQLAAVLLAKVTEENRDSLVRALVSQLKRISLVGGTVGYSSTRPPDNAILPE